MLKGLGRRQEENQLFFLSEFTQKKPQKKPHFLSGAAKVEDDVLLTDKRVFSTMIY